MNRNSASVHLHVLLLFIDLLQKIPPTTFFSEQLELDDHTGQSTNISVFKSFTTFSSVFPYTVLTAIVIVCAVTFPLQIAMIVMGKFSDQQAMEEV